MVGSTQDRALKSGTLHFRAGMAGSFGTMGAAGVRGAIMARGGRQAASRPLPQEGCGGTHDSAWDHNKRRRRGMHCILGPHPLYAFV